MGRSQGQPRFGTVKNLVIDRGFGFITPEDGGAELFFHYSGLLGVRIDALRQGTRVKFTAGSGAKGPRAENVELA